MRVPIGGIAFHKTSLLTMGSVTLFGFGVAVLAGAALLWTAEILFQGSVASAAVLVAITIIALVIARPGCGLRPTRLGRRVLVPFGVLLASAAAAGAFLRLGAIDHPYDVTRLDVAAALPAIAAITGVEEILFRHAIYRWLELRTASPRTIVIATAIVFAAVHLGALFVAASVHAGFHVLQSLYLVWVGLLLGEIRRLTSSWAMAWLGHFGYNVTVLSVLQVSE